MHSEHIEAILPALMLAAKQIKNPKLNRTNPRFKSKYADLESVLAATRALNENGLWVTHAIEIIPQAPGDTLPILTTTVYHTSEQWIRSVYPLPKDASPQEMGSAITYARRYNITAIANVVGEEDDDANAADHRPAPHPQADAYRESRAPVPPTLPPTDPATGQPNPHYILPEKAHAGGKDWDYVGWGTKFAAALNNASTLADIQEWISKNKDFLELMGNGRGTEHMRKRLDTIAKERSNVLAAAA